MSEERVIETLGPGRSHGSTGGAPSQKCVIFNDDDQLYPSVEYQQQQLLQLPAEQPQQGQAVRSARRGGKDQLSQYKSLSCRDILL
jgi:hypothetical protein